MHQRIGRKITIYFLLLLLFGSINRLGLNNINFDKILEIKIYGLKEKENVILSNNIKKLNLNNIFFINRKKISELIESNSLVESYNIFKKYPSTIDVRINQTTFLARISNNKNIYIIGSNGKFIKNNYSSIELPYIFGKPKINEFLNFKTLIDKSKFSYKEIKNLYFFQSKRWDLELKNGIIIKLPNTNMKHSLDISYEFMNNKNLNKIKVIDLRVNNQIILNG